ncbi:hypothetical protein BH09BAC4_BH09BAC4_01550 [soil metagenome]
MVLVFFLSRGPNGNYQKGSFGDQELASCLDMLSALVRQGWQLLQVQLVESPGSAIWLPVEAFDGAPLEEHMNWLKQEWEELLYQS